MLPPQSRLHNALVIIICFSTTAVLLNHRFNLLIYTSLMQNNRSLKSTSTWVCFVFLHSSSFLSLWIFVCGIASEHSVVAWRPLHWPNPPAALWGLGTADQPALV